MKKAPREVIARGFFLKRWGWGRVSGATDPWRGAEIGKQQPVGQQQGGCDKELDRQVAGGPGQPARDFEAEDAEERGGAGGEVVAIAEQRRRRSGEGDAEEQGRVEDRGGCRRQDRRLPPGHAAHAVEQHDVEQMREEEGRAGCDGDARRRKEDGERDREREADEDHLARGGGAEAAVGQVGDEKGRRIGEGAPGQQIGEVDAGERSGNRILDEDIRGDDNQRHRQDRLQGARCGESAKIHHVRHSKGRHARRASRIWRHRETGQRIQHVLPLATTAKRGAVRLFAQVICRQRVPSAWPGLATCARCTRRRCRVARIGGLHCCAGGDSGAAGARSIRPRLRQLPPGGA